MAYKLKHKRTGLYFGPSTTKIIKDPKYRIMKTNLHKYGKVYGELRFAKSALKLCSRNYYDGETGQNGFIEEENAFEIVEV